MVGSTVNPRPPGALDLCGNRFDSEDLIVVGLTLEVYFCFVFYDLPKFDLPPDINSPRPF